MANYLGRSIALPDQSFFLFGPRGVGKSTWIRGALPKAELIDLLDSEVQLQLSASPKRLEAMLGEKKAGDWVIIDEVQKVPALLDEIHRLIESRKLRFALTGSSARKLKREGANLLAGRALVQRLEQFSYSELRSDPVSLTSLLEWGGLPSCVLNPKNARRVLSAYVLTYLQEEIRQEGLVRRIEPFSRFLEVAGLFNGQVLSMEGLARDAKVPRTSLVEYFQILEDTWIAKRLPSYQPAIKAREVAHPKFYFFDPGVARAAAGLLGDTLDSTWLGSALETWVFHELRVYNQLSEKERPLFYYRTGDGSEIDFVVETRKKTMSAGPEVVCIEVKHSKKWDARFEKPARSLRDSGKIKVKGMFGIYLGKEILAHDGFTVLPFEEFVQRLFAGKIF
jgi:predicted AAA+ superfamily ATPase